MVVSGPSRRSISEDSLIYNLYFFIFSVGTKTTDRSGSATAATGGCSTEISCMSSSGCVTTTTAAPSSGSSPPVIRVTLASLDECNVLLRDGLDFYGATYFPTEPALSTSIARAGGKKTVMHNRYVLNTSTSQL